MTTDQAPDFNKYGPCPMCDGEEVYAWSRWCNSDLMYSYIQCDDCRTVSKNTTSTFTWSQVVESWNEEKRKAELEMDLEKATLRDLPVLVKMKAAVEAQITRLKGESALVERLDELETDLLKVSLKIEELEATE